MSREEYLHLCQTCDAILHEKGASISTAAIAWLHVLNEHPSNQLKYDVLFNKQLAGKPILYRTLMFEFIRDIVISIKSSSRKSIEPIFEHKNQVLFISHLLNKDQISIGSDFYFGRLPEILNQRGISTASILVNHSTLEVEDLKREWKNSYPIKTPFPETLNIFDELYIRISLLKQSLRLRLKSWIEKEAFKKKVYINSSHEALSQSSIFSLRAYLFVKNVVEKCDTSAVVTTFEGHAYERMIFAAANTSKKKVYSLGYHHTIIFPQQHAAFRTVDKKFRPEHILTAGKITNEEFSKRIPTSRVHNIGIHRTASIDTSIPDISGKPSTCIILPDGIISEVLILFRFAISTAKLAPEITFILRLHPVLNKEELLNLYPEFRILPENVSFSTNDFATDLKGARWALYRGSNSAIYAAMEGIRPVYVSIPNELQIDSLDKFVNWKKTITEIPELIAIINDDLLSTIKKLEEESIETINFCRQYFMPLDVSKFLDVIDSCRN